MTGSTERIDATAYFEAYASHEHADVTPRYASIAVTQGFLSSLDRLRGLCASNGLTQVRCASTPAWGPPGIEDEIRLESPVLVVTEWSFWFEEESKHSDFSFKTRLQPFDEFVERVLGNADGSPVLFGPDEMLQHDMEPNAEVAFATPE